MLRSSPLLLWLGFTLASWSSQPGSTEVDLGAGLSDYSYIQTCGGQRRVVASPVYAHVKRVQVSGLVWSGEASVTPGTVQEVGSDDDAMAAECTRECLGDRVLSAHAALRVGYQGPLFAGELGPALVVHPDQGWFPVPSLELRYGDPQVFFAHASLLAGPFTGNLEVDAVQLGGGKRWDKGEVLLTTNPLLLTGEMPPTLRLSFVGQVSEGVSLGLDLGASAPFDNHAQPGLRGLILLRLNPHT